MSNYTLSVSLNEAHSLGFVDESGERVEIEKVIDEENGRLIIQKKTDNN